jgi:hypothetical protein
LQAPEYHGDSRQEQHCQVLLACKGDRIPHERRSDTPIAKLGAGGNCSDTADREQRSAKAHLPDIKLVTPGTAAIQKGTPHHAREQTRPALPTLDPSGDGGIPLGLSRWRIKDLREEIKAGSLILQGAQCLCPDARRVFVIHLNVP